MSFVAHAISLLPDTFMGYVFELLIGTIIALISGSFFEYGIHRYIMHDRRIRDLAHPGTDAKDGIYYKHAVLHHGVFYKQFDLETDPVGKELNIVFTWDDTARVLVGLIPILLAISYFISPIIAIPFIPFILFHNLAWNLIHHEMHIPKHRWWTKTSVYRFLARHHYMHHKSTGKNFNVVLPLADYVFGTKAMPRDEDIAELRRLGYQS